MAIWIFIGLAFALLVLPTIKNTVHRRLLTRKGMIPFKLLLGVNGLDEATFWECCRHLELHPRVKRVGTMVMIERKVAQRVVDRAISLKGEAKSALNSDVGLAVGAALLAIPGLIKSMDDSSPPPPPPPPSVDVNLKEAATIVEALDRLGVVPDDCNVRVLGFWDWLEECEEVDEAMRLLCKATFGRRRRLHTIRDGSPETRELMKLERAVLQALPSLRSLRSVASGRPACIVAVREAIISLSNHMTFEFIKHTYIGKRLRSALHASAFGAEDNDLKRFLLLSGLDIADTNSKRTESD